MATSRSRPSGSSLPADPPGLLDTLRPHLRPELATLVGTLLLGLVIAALGAAQPLLTRMLIDEGLVGRHFDRILVACAGMLAIAVIGMALGALHRAIYIRASGRVLFSLRSNVYQHLLRVSPRRLATLPTGDLVNRLDADVAEVQRFGIDSAAAFVSGALSLLIVGAVMLRLSWQLCLIVLVVLPLQLAVRHVTRPRIERTTREVRESASGISAFLIETIAGARAVQAAAAEDWETRRLGALGESYLARVVRAQLIGFATGAAASLLGNVATAGVFLAGGWMVLGGRLSIGTLVAFVAYLGRSAGSASGMVGLYTSYQRARVSLRRIGELTALPVVPERSDARPLPAAARGDLDFEHLVVRSPRDGRAVLDGIDLHVPAGTKLLIRGASGAGKSTLVDVLQRFLEPDGGSVRLDGVALADYRLADLRRRVVAVEHSPVLFRGSILDNLRYGHPDAPDDQVRRAAVAAGVDEFVRDLPDGYQTRVGDGGSGLSTGQRQRIALARASLDDPLVVILDEAMSGLDRDTALVVSRAIDSAFAQRTRIVITHGDSATQDADVAFELVDGRLTLLAPRGLT